MMYPVEVISLGKYQYVASCGGDQSRQDTTEIHCHNSSQLLCTFMFLYSIKT